jgi:hypothetical protein
MWQRRGTLPSTLGNSEPPVPDALANDPINAESHGSKSVGIEELLRPVPRCGMQRASTTARSPQHGCGSSLGVYRTAPPESHVEKTADLVDARNVPDTGE